MPTRTRANTRANTRLRQLVLAAPDLEPVAARIQQAFNLPDPFVDPGVKEFGLVNAVFPVGDCFLEIVSPTTDQAPAARYLARRGNPEAAGYMAIFQVDDIAAARRRIQQQNIRIVWQADLPDIAGTHLHPADVPGAIVSIDWADPPESWHWAGPNWRGHKPHDAQPGGINSFILAVDDPASVEKRWTEVLDTPLADLGIDVVRTTVAGTDGIVGIRLSLPASPPADLAVGTVRIRN